MRSIAIVAAKEFRDGVRNRWILIVTALMAAFAIVLALLGSAPTGTTRISALMVTVVSLSSLSIFFVPLIALLMSYDSIVGEHERGTLLLLLAYPVARWQVLAGKFLGQLSLLGVAILAGYGLAGLAIALRDDGGFAEQAWTAFAGLLFSSVLLGAVFLALGLLVSAWVRERGTAAGIAIGVWVLFVLVYDLGLLGLLTSRAAAFLDDRLVTILLLANPADVYRIMNLAGSADAQALSALSGLAGAVSVAPAPLTLILLGWVIAPFALACALFRRRQI